MTHGITDADRKAAEAVYSDNSCVREQLYEFGPALGVTIDINGLAAHFARHRTTAVRLAVEAERERIAEMLRIEAKEPRAIYCVDTLNRIADELTPTPTT